MICTYTAFDWSGDWIGLLAAGLLGLFFLLQLSYRFFQSYQLNSYRLERYAGWLRDTRGKYLLRMLLISLLGAVSLMVADALFYRMAGRVAMYIGLGLLCLYAALYLVGERRQGRKTPLRYTPRMVRLHATYLALCLGALFACTYWYDPGPYYLMGILFAILPLLVPVLTLLAMLINAPFEALNNRRYLSKARKKLGKLSNLTVIGITGSYGKTSVKNILAAMLDAKYQVAATPDSYNTPLGVTRCVLSGAVDAGTEFFLCEMGARKRGDIAELCDLVRPKIGVLTGIASQHMEYFKSLNNILDTKFELVEALPEDGFAVFNPGAGELYKRAACEKYLVGRDASAGEVRLTEDGSSFLLRAGGFTVPVSVKLLGSHNIENVLAAALVCVRLGYTAEELAEAIARVQPVPHRLQLIPASNGIRIIDDTYNSNPVSAKAAIDTVKEMEGRKVIVTCGFVELGPERDEAHLELGEEIAGVFQQAILVGMRQTAKIYEGLERAGFDKDAVTVVANLAAAQAEMSATLHPKDVVLLLNDLPDNYTESA